MRNVMIIIILGVTLSGIRCASLTENVENDLTGSSRSIAVKKNSKFGSIPPELAKILIAQSRQAVNETTGDAQVTATRQGPCQCANGLCSCCSRILLSTFRQKACVNVTYEPEDFRFTAKILMNDRILYTRSVSGKNPRPLCVPVPRIPVVSACVRFYNIFFQGRNVHACVDMEGKFSDTTLFKVGLDCIRLGSNGVAVVKPEDGGGLGQVDFFPGNSDDDDDADNDEYEGEANDDDDDDDDDDLFDY